MAYRIDYGESPYTSDKSCFFLRSLMTCLFFLLFLVLVSAFWPEGREVLRLMLIPDATLEAAETFVSELHCGSNLGSSMSDFFQKLIKYETIH